MISAVWIGTPFTRRAALGLLFGISGVALVANVRPALADGYYWLAIFAGLLASVGYGLSGTYVRKHASHIPPASIAAGNQMIAGLLILPMLFWNPAPHRLSPLLVFDLLALALVCSAIAYVIYYRLLADIGPTKALTVTFVVPMFGMLWGCIFLGEAITLTMLSGCTLIIAGTVVLHQS
jgi:drug/metabolite transporter (DMT)-like permease